MSTKCTLYFQEGKRPDVPNSHGDYIHVYWDLNGHAGTGLYIDINGDPSFIEDGPTLVEQLGKLKFDSFLGIE